VRVRFSRQVNDRDICLVKVDRLSRSSPSAMVSGTQAESDDGSCTVEVDVV
jgi:hypothetical protein